MDKVDAICYFIATILIWLGCFAIGYCKGFKKGRPKTHRILTYGELRNLPVDTEVIVHQFDTEDWFIQHGCICIENGIKKVDVYDGYFEFDQADIWLDI